MTGGVRCIVGIGFCWLDGLAGRTGWTDCSDFQGVVSSRRWIHSRYMTRSTCWPICPLSYRNLAKSSVESMSHLCTLLSSILPLSFWIF